jgi:adenylate cyclase
MDVLTYLESLNREIDGIVSPDFQTKVKKLRQVSETEQVCVKSKHKEDLFNSCRIRTCVLYVDIRRQIHSDSEVKSRDKAKVYFAFLQLITGAAEFHGGRVCNLAADRMMVVFDEEDSFTDAVNTAYLLNTVAQTVLAPHFPHRSIHCGIGIDYGSLMVSRVPRRQNEEYESPSQDLVWLGKPAHQATKLMVVASSALTRDEGVEQIGRYFHGFKEWGWRVRDEYAGLINVLGTRPANQYTGPRGRLNNLDAEPGRVEPILVSGRVLKGLKKSRPDDVSIKRLWWRKKAVHIAGYNGEVFGANVIYTG